MLYFGVVKASCYMYWNLQEKGQEPKETDRFKTALASKTGEYAEEILSPHFGGMIQFVKEAENLLQKEKGDVIASDEGTATAYI